LRSGKQGTTSIKRAHRTGTRRKCSNLIYCHSTKCLQSFNNLLYICNCTIQFLPCTQCVKTAFFVTVHMYIWKLLSPLGSSCHFHVQLMYITYPPQLHAMAFQDSSINTCVMKPINSSVVYCLPSHISLPFNIPQGAI
jgi:hypothetical protein